MAGLLEHLMAVRTFVDTPQHKRWIKGYRIETVGRNAYLTTTGVGGSHDSDAGSKIPQSPAKGTSVEERRVYIRHARLPDRFYKQS
jgi:hypothetical protein